MVEIWSWGRAIEGDREGELIGTGPSCSPYISSAWANCKATKIEIDTVPGVGDCRDWSCCGEA
jgi:hypothetical protein